MRAFQRTGELLFRVADGVAAMRFAGRTDRSLVREFFVRHGIAPTAAHFTRFLDAYVFLLEHHLGHLQGHWCRGVAGFLSQLRTLPGGPVLGLLTGNIQLGAEIKLRHHGLWEPFVTGAFGDDHEDRNQLAAIALARGRRLLGRELSPREILVVGDTPHDIACGRAVGARVLAVTTGGANREELVRHRPDRLVDDLSEITAEEACALDGAGCS